MPSLESLPLQPGNWAHLNDYLTQITTGGSLTALGAFSVKDALYGAVGNGVADDSAAIQAAYAAAVATGGVVFFPPGSYKLNTTVSVAPNLSKRVLFVGSGQDATTIVLGSTCKGFVSLTGAAAGDTYKNVTVQDLTVDASAITVNTQTGAGILGTLKNGVGSSDQLDTNLADLVVRRCKGIGGPVNTDGTHQFWWVAVMTSVDTASTQRTVQRILVEDVDLSGGDSGIYVGAQRRNAAATDMANVLVDDVTIQRWKHAVTVSAPTAFFTSNHVICPHRGRAKKVRVRDGYGYGCGDAGLEFDTCEDAIAERVTVEDAWNHNFFHVNYNTLPIATFGQIRLFKCMAKRTGLTVTSGFGGSTGQGFGFTLADNSNFGHPLPTLMKDCAFVKTTADLAVQGEAIFTVAPQRLDIEDFLYDSSSVNYSNVSETPIAIWFRPAAGNTGFLRVKRARFQVAGTKVSGSTLWSAIKAFYGNVGVQLEDVVIDFNVSGVGATDCRALYLGDDTLATTLAATVRGCKFERSSDTSAWLVVVGPTGTTTLQPRLLVDDCSLRAISLVNASTETKTLVFYRNGGASQQNYANTFVRGSTPGSAKFPPATAAITPGASPYTYQNQDGYTQNVFVQGGTVSKIEWSQDNTVFVDTGVIAGRFVLEGGEYLKVTYSVVPTMTKAHFKSV